MPRQIGQGWDRGRKARDPKDVEEEVQALSNLDMNGLRAKWRKVMGNDPAPSLYRDFLMRALAYRIQANAFGDIDQATRQMLAQLAKGDLSVLEPKRPILKPGTILVREWDNKLERVTVLQEGFAWKGMTYSSLSAVARAISGTPWNGFVFFGLRNKKTKKGESHGTTP